MQEMKQPDRGIILSGQNEIENSVRDKHEQLLKNDIQAGRETKKVPLSISDFARNYQLQSLAEGKELPYKQAETMAKDFIQSQVNATNHSGFKANRISFTVPDMPWKKRK